MSTYSIALCGFTKEQHRDIYSALKDFPGTECLYYDHLDGVLNENRRHDILLWREHEFTHEMVQKLADVRRKNAVVQLLVHVDDIPEGDVLREFAPYSDFIDFGEPDSKSLAGKVRYLLHKTECNASVLQGIPDAFFVVSRSGEVLTHNFPDAFEFPWEAASRPRHITQLGLPDWVVQALKNKVRKAIDDAEQQRLEATSCASHPPLTFEWRVSRISAEYALVLARDITDARHALNVKELEAERRRERERLQSLQSLTGGIAHDYNNLLVGVLGNADLALMHLPPESPVRKYVRRIEEAGVMAAELTKQMLAYAGKSRPDLSKVNIDVLVHELIPVVKATLKSNISFTKSLNGGDNVVAVDMFLMRQVFMSIINNSIESLDGAPGSISVSTGVDSLSGDNFADKYRNPDMREGSYAYFRISDDGPGMVPELVHRVFDPFYTTKFLGRGLGLAAMLGIIRSHGGGVEVRTAKGEGFSLTVYLPVLEFEENDTDQKLYSHRATGKVLLLESDTTSANVARNMLEHIGYSVSSALGLDEALSLLSGRNGFAFVIVDLNTVFVEGVSALKRIIDASSSSPVVVCSSLSRAPVAEKLGRGELGVSQ
ncbi:MAG: ATP-binding protein [Planctomycetota bacterium]|nr:ATP-binding protein [Planctomycetota bacterium]